MAPLRHRGLKLSAVAPGALVWLIGMAAWAADAPGHAAAAHASEGGAPADKAGPHPLQFRYAMPMDGFIAIHIIDKKTGKRVRRLVAEVSREAGTVTENWDLKDDDGQYVPPGDYTWTAIARPPLKLTYEITVNNAGQPAWFAPAPAKGGGGWLADHTPPQEVFAVGDYVFMGSPVAESGHAMIATDRDGNKLWGQNSAFGGFLGVRRYAGDDRYAYMVNGAGIMRIDTKNNFAMQPIKIDFTYSREMPGPGSGWAENIGGVALKGDRMYFAYNAPPVAWVQSSFTPDMVDALKCSPIVRMARGKRENYRESDYDEVAMFHSVVMDGAVASSQQSTFGDAPKNGPLAGTLTVAFKQPIAVGSVLVQDTSVRVFALKPGAKLTDTEPDEGPDAGDAPEADPLDEAIWVPLRTMGKPGYPGIAMADQGFATRALRFKAPRLNYALLMSRRFEDIAPEAERVYIDGAGTPRGGWRVERPQTNPILPNNPAVMALLWKAPMAMHGLTFVAPDQSSTAIDAFTGPANVDPKTALDDDRYWKQVGETEEQLFGPFPQDNRARNVDFSEEVQTRALRLRAIHYSGWQGGFNTKDLHVDGPHKTGFDCVLVYSHLAGHDPELPVELSERLTEVQLSPDKPTGTVLRHTPLRKPGYIRFSPDGTLYAVTDGRIATVPLDGGAPKEVIPRSALEQPDGIAFDAAGLLYVSDQGPRVVKVFDPKTGKLVRTIGKPGPRPLGPWDPERFDVPAGITIDSGGKLWVAEPSFQPKRISRWTLEGKHEKSFLGPTTYGGGGALDPGDRNVLNYNGMKFVIDWANRTWKLDSILYRPGVGTSLTTAMPDRAIWYKGKRYLAGDPGGGGMAGGNAVLCIEKDGVAVPFVAAGNMVKWKEVDTQAALRQAFGKLNRNEYGFLWYDRNGDGQVQVAEVQTSTKLKLGGTYWPTKLGDDLSLNFGGIRLRPSGWRPDGLPEYDLDKAESVPLFNNTWTAVDGYTFSVNSNGAGRNVFVAPDGKTVLWDYVDNYYDVQGSHKIGYDRPPGTLVGEFQTVGHLNVGAEELFVDNGNHSDWFAYTKDGILAATIFGGPGKIGKRGWTMPSWVPGNTELNDLSLGEEHFFGSICRANDGKIYAVAGHNHNSVVRVDGLDDMKRLNGAFSVTRADIEQAIAWGQQQTAQEQQRTGPKIGQVPFVDHPMHIDGAPDDWPASLFMTIHEYYHEVKQKWVVDTDAALAYDTDHLYVVARVSDGSPLKNGATDMPTIYKYGDAVDVTLGLDPKADPLRTGPVTGDLRLLITRVQGKPVVVVYRYNVPGAPDDKRTTLRSPLAETSVDIVDVIKDAEVAVIENEMGRYYVLEAAIPWKSLGERAPVPGSKLRGDVGVLYGDDNGVKTVSRYYWAGKNQTVVSDIAIEARAMPAVWGQLNFVEPDKTLHFGPGDVELNP